MIPRLAVFINVAAFEILRGGHGAFTNEVRRYTTASLSALLTREGLVVERASYTHATLFPLLLLVRGWQRWRGGGEAEPSEGDLVVPSAPVNALLSTALTIESWLLRVVNLPFGSSVLCLARKPR